jgi:hypothetical protein
MRKIGASLNFKIELGSLHIRPGASFTKLTHTLDVNFGSFLLCYAQGFVNYNNSFFF